MIESSVDVCDCAVTSNYSERIYKNCNKKLHKQQHNSTNKCELNCNPTDKINNNINNNNNSSGNGNSAINNINHNVIELNRIDHRSIVSAMKPIDYCCDTSSCITLKDINESFNNCISNEQAWAIIYQTVTLYRYIFSTTSNDTDYPIRLKIPLDVADISVHKDGSLHISPTTNNDELCTISQQKKILLNLGVIVFNALDYNNQNNEELTISPELEQVINHMISQDNVDDEGIEHDSDYIEDGKVIQDTSLFDDILEKCSSRITTRPPEEHYRAVCRALATESFELKTFLKTVESGETEALRAKVDAETSRQEMENLEFSDWARFWIQVVAELRRGVRLKKCDYPPTPNAEYELTPYEILMHDIRAKKYNLRKVMVNGDIPPRVKKDAHAVILEFIRSRPPLKKASDRKLPPPRESPLDAREKLLKSIQEGIKLRPVSKLSNKTKENETTALLPPNKLEEPVKPPLNSSEPIDDDDKNSKSSSRKLRLIRVDPSLFQEDENDSFAISSDSAISSNQSSLLYVSSDNNENDPNDLNTVVLRRKDRLTSRDTRNKNHQKFLESYDLATTPRSMRRHSIVGCQSNWMTNSYHSMQSTTTTSSDHHRDGIETMPIRQTMPIPTTSTDRYDTPNRNKTTDEKPWVNPLNLTDNQKLSLTLEEIIHIRSVLTKAELDGLPVDVNIKEDVEKRKVCFLCFRTRFTLFQRGVQCKLCKRTVCSKCHSKMRVPLENFRSVPVVLLSPSLMSSPNTSNVPSPSHQAYHTPSNNVDESFPKTLIERLLRFESDKKNRIHNGHSVPSSPRHLSASSTPGCSLQEQNAMISSLNRGYSNKISAGLYNNINDVREIDNNSLMTRSMEGPRSLPPQSPARPHSNCSTLDRRSRFRNIMAYNNEQKEQIRGELMAVCNDCRGLYNEIIKSSKQSRSFARNEALKNLTLDLSPVYKGGGTSTLPMKKI